MSGGHNFYPTPGPFNPTFPIPHKTGDTPSAHALAGSAGMFPIPRKTGDTTS
jgi:hypothetical protein